MGQGHEVRVGEVKVYPHVVLVYFSQAQDHFVE